MNKNRRKFIKNSSVLISGSLLSPMNSSFPMFKNSLSSKTRIGIIGTGSRGAGLMNIINGIDGLIITGICDVLPFRLKRAKQIAPKAKSFINYNDLLAYNELDAVIISSPLNTHYQISLDAIKADVHIYCEKTMIKGVKETITLVSEVKNNHKKIFQTGHQYHSSRLYSHIVEIINNGKIGKITSVVAQWNRNGNWRRPVPNIKYERQINWRMYREFSYGLLAELSSHQIDFVNWMLNSHPEKVNGFGDISYWKDGRETYDNTHVLFSYPNGVKASFSCLTSNAKDDYQIKIHGDKGTIIIGQTNAWFYPEGKYDKVYGDVDGTSGATTNWVEGKGTPINYQHIDPTKQALEDFRDSIKFNTNPLSNVITGSKASFCVDMGIRSMDENKTIYWDSLYNI